MALNFVVRTVFIHTLSETYLGINGLLSSVLTVLNLSNLGIDGAIVYAMYKPMAVGDVESCKSLLRFYRNSYRLIGWVILLLGLAATPLLPYLTRGGTDLVDLRIVYWLHLAQTVTSYWFFAYLTSVPYSDQKRYLVTEITYFTGLATAVVNIALLLLLRSRPALSFYVYTAVGVGMNIARNLAVRQRIVRRYPWTLDREVSPLSKETKTGVYKNVAGMFTNNVCRVLNDGIDTTVISAFLGLSTAGIYSNYLSLRLYVLTGIRTVLDPLTASVGNLCAVESSEKKESFFVSLQFVCFWIYGFCAICLWNLYDAFIAGVWLRDVKWLLSGSEVFLLAFNLLVEGLAKAVIIYRDANGLYWQTKFRYIFSSVLNAVLSIVLTGPLKMGVSGALLGTTVSLAVMLSYDPVLVYREVFHKKAGEYYRMYFRDLGIVLLTGGIVYAACLPFSAYTAGNFLIRLGLCLVIPNGLWYIVFRHDSRFLYLRDTLLRYIRRAGKKRKE